MPPAVAAEDHTPSPLTSPYHLAKKVTLEDGFSRDVRGVGHHGPPDLELTIGSVDDLNRANPLTLKSFDEN